jgi:hypothetical protein
MSAPTIPLKLDLTDSELTSLIEALKRGASTATDFVDRRSLLVKITAALEKLSEAGDLPRTG